MRRAENAALRLLALFAAALALAAASPAAPSPDAASDAARAELLRRHAALLAEKGVADEAGREIAGRLEGLVAAARAKGASTAKDVVREALEALNFSASNLAGFPPAAFDRPIGHRLESFGRTVSPDGIEARPEGSGCPVGGLGAGGFERLMDGTFSTWFLKLGWTVEDTVWADQFHVFMRTGGRSVARTLATAAPPPGAGLGAWAWSYPAGKGDYYALYPKSGFSYEENPEFPAKLAVVQFSPVIAGNYKETSYPVAVYRWIAVNPTKQPVDVSILLTWENMVGWEAVRARAADGTPLRAAYVWDRSSDGNVNEPVENGRHKGVLFLRRGRDVRSGNALSGSMAIAVLESQPRTRVHIQPAFDPRGDGSDVWTRFAADGSLDATRAAEPAGAGQGTGAALAVSFTLKPGERLEVPFAVAWDFPYYEFGSGAKHRKKYTAFHGDSGGNAFRIASEALTRSAEWERSVDAWQRPILAEPDLPDWLKQALLNELYVLSETGVWDAVTDLYTVLESADSLAYGATDADAFCWHVLRLWPELEKRHLEFVARTVPLEDPAFRAFGPGAASPDGAPNGPPGRSWGTVKVPGMAPHDLGSPLRRPWTLLNAFGGQDANARKDLNPKLVLRAYRDFQADGGFDIGFLMKMFEASALALDTLERRFGDKVSHLPSHEGVPDQPYGAWRMEGESAYSGLLWLAGLKAAVRMGETLSFRGLGRVSSVDIASVTAKYKDWYSAGRASLRKLWNERAGCFRVDAGTDDIMADQLFGVWYARQLGLEAGDDTDIVPRAQVSRALRTVYERNVLGHGNGLMGAVTGRKADGSRLGSREGDEVRVGATYSLAAHLALDGFAGEALRAAYGVYHVVYSPFGQGYFFMTPEAYLDPAETRWDDASKTYGERTFREMKAMRPGAVWALYEALTKKRP